MQWPGGCASSSAQAACSNLGKACALQAGARRRLAASRRLAEDKQEGPGDQAAAGGSFARAGSPSLAKAC